MHLGPVSNCHFEWFSTEKTIGSSNPPLSAIYSETGQNPGHSGE